MQLSRVVIAAVFFVAGALLIVPMLTSTSTSSRAASSTPAPSSPLPSSHSPGPTHRPAHQPTHRPTHKPTPTPTTTKPVPTATPGSPLAVRIGAVRCPGRSLSVSVTNAGRQTEDYAITSDGAISVADRIPAGATRRSTVNLREDHDTTIAVTWHNVPVRTLDRTANCVHAGKRTTLPHTGPDSGTIVARVLTGLAAMLTGIAIFWYGRLWPRRGSRMFDER